MRLRHVLGMMRPARIPLAMALTISVAACHGPPDRAPAVDREDVPPATYGPAAQGLQMRARPVRKVIPARGLLLVEITIRSLADSIVRFHPLFMIGANLRAHIVGPDGLPVPLTAAIDPPSALNAGTVWLEPGELFTDTVDLNCVFPAPERESCMAPYDLSRSGEYRIELRLRLPVESQRRRNMVALEAEPFTVRVDRDHPAEDAGTGRILVETY